MNDVFPTLTLSDLDISRTCCFSGHRSIKLPGEGDRGNAGMKRLESTLEMEIYKLIQEKGIRYFISGMANGVDLICAEAVVRLASTSCPGAKLICAIPYLGQMSEMRSPRDKYIYSMIEQSSYRSVILAEGYHKECYKQRNRFMVDNSSCLLAVYKPSLKGSGTFQTMNYAKTQGLDIRVIDLDKNPQFYS